MLRNKKTSRTILEQYIENRDLLLDALPFPVSIVDTYFNIVKVNKMFTDLSPAKDQLLSKPIKKFCYV